MPKLQEHEPKVEEKSSKIATFWQFVKYTMVSLLAMIVQISSQNILSAIPAIKALAATEVHWFVFNYTAEQSGLKWFIAFNVGNILAQIVAFFVNREKTFKGTTSIPITLTIYMVFTLALICFSAWLSPVLNGFLLSHHVAEKLAENLAMMACSFIQFVLYFPLDKILMRNKEAVKA